jgi:hypothetical protein
MHNQQRIHLNSTATLQPLTLGKGTPNGVDPSGVPIVTTTAAGGGLVQLPGQLIGHTGAAVMALGGALGAGGKVLVNGGVSIVGSAAGTAAGVFKDVIFADGKEVINMGLGLVGAVTGGGGGDDAAVVVPRLDVLRDELDDIIASECLLCGDLMIKTIDQPFIANNEHELELSWGVQ